MLKTQKLYRKPCVTLYSEEQDSTGQQNYFAGTIVRGRIDDSLKKSKF